MNKQASTPSHSSKAAGIWNAVGAFSAWGILPLYWKALESLSAVTILAHRIFWSFIFVAILLVYQGRLTELKNMVSNKRTWITALTGAVLISANWFIYIWAVNNNQVVEASLGYYINPLIVVLLGVIVYKERLGFWQIVSLILATLGVIVSTVEYGKIPWISISLALTFGLYGLVKKSGGLESIIALALETTIAAPLAFVYLLKQQAVGAGAFGNATWSMTVMLMCSGVVTSIPLIWFARGAKLAPLSTIGFIQYLSPSISLFLGVFVFKERFTHADIISFGMIWAALLLYSLSEAGLLNRLTPWVSKESLQTSTQSK